MPICGAAASRNSISRQRQLSSSVSGIPMAQHNHNISRTPNNPSVDAAKGCWTSMHSISQSAFNNLVRAQQTQRQAAEKRRFARFAWELVRLDDGRPACTLPCDWYSRRQVMLFVLPLTVPCYFLLKTLNLCQGGQWERSRRCDILCACSCNLHSARLADEAKEHYDKAASDEEP